MTFCKAVWNNMHIQPNGNTSPCCAWPNSVEFDRDSVKSQMLANEPVVGCGLCYAQERSGQPSLRGHYNTYLTGKDIVAVDLSVDNVCNLQCLMCSSEYSHANAHREREVLGHSITGDTVLSNDVYKSVHWPSVRNLKLFGGEPTYSPGVQRFLEWAEHNVDFSVIHIEVQTNNTIQPNQRLDAVLRRCASLKVIASMDGTPEVSRSIRQGTPAELQWSYWENMPNAELIVHSAVGIYNALDVVDHQAWLRQHHPQWKYHRECLVSPEYLNLQNMPEELKQLYAQHLMPEDLLDYMFEPGVDLYSEFYAAHHAYQQRYTVLSPSVLADYMADNPRSTDYAVLRRLFSTQ